MYLPPLTAKDLETQVGVPAGTFQNISTYAHLDAPILGSGLDIPVILFSPDLGASRLLYTTFVQDMASEGYAVPSIDHPYDASIVELSDGLVIAANISEAPDQITLTIAFRTADSRFVLKVLAAGNNFKVPPSTYDPRWIFRSFAWGRHRRHYDGPR